MTAMPDFKVVFDGYSYFVSWNDDEHRYHFWLKNDGSVADDIIHRNTNGVFRRLDQNAKKWAPVIGYIMAKIKAENLITKARQAREAEDKAKAEERERAYNEKLLARLEKALLELPGDLAEDISLLSNKARIAFVKACQLSYGE